MRGRSQELVVRAMRVTQRKDAPLYVFGIDGRALEVIATVDRARRAGDAALHGYQRAEVGAHVEDIARYLNSPLAMLPNAIIVAFEDVTFVADPGVQPTWGTFGQLHVPTVQNGRAYRAGWIVDGQQRAAALRRLPEDRRFPVVVVGFHASDRDTQAEQFVLVNRSKPLPRDLMVELLADMRADIPLPTSLRVSQHASRVIRVLRSDQSSPFYGRIREFDERGQSPRISQAALIEVVRDGVRRHGLFWTEAGPVSVGEIAASLSSFYGGVAQLWPHAWAGSPWTSRLVHGVGIVALSKLIPIVFSELNASPSAPPSPRAVERHLVPLRAHCAWTSGEWRDLHRHWDELQNTAADKRLLASHLLVLYSRHC